MAPVFNCYCTFLFCFYIFICTLCVHAKRLLQTDWLSSCTRGGYPASPTPSVSLHPHTGSSKGWRWPGTKLFTFRDDYRFFPLSERLNFPDWNPRSVMLMLLMTWTCLPVTCLPACKLFSSLNHTYTSTVYKVSSSATGYLRQSNHIMIVSVALTVF